VFVKTFPRAAGFSADSTLVIYFGMESLHMFVQILFF